MKRVTIHTDGACHGNPGPGGWAAHLQFGKIQKDICGGDPATTNNRMELQAAIQGLQALKEPCAVDLFTDSEYLRQGITGWIKGWKSRGWITKEGEPVKNEDLWRALDDAAQRHEVQWHWVKGHAGHHDNERCDELATQALEKEKGKHTSAGLNHLIKEFRSRR